MVVVVVVMFVSALLALWYSLKIGSADASEAFEVGVGVVAPKRCFWKEFVHLRVAVLSREYEEEWLYHLRKGSYDSDVCLMDLKAWL